MRRCCPLIDDIAALLATSDVRQRLRRRTGCTRAADDMLDAACRCVGLMLHVRAHGHICSQTRVSYMCMYVTVSAVVRCL